MKMKNLIEIAVNASLEAGKEILDVYGQDDFQIENKENDTPLTIADKRAHDCIMKYLITTNIPVLSEEGKEIDYSERKQWSKFWLVDPLDGTKEFIKRNGEFTVNIALIENNVPVAGVIYVPVKETLYFTFSENDTFRANNIIEFTSFDEIIQRSEKLPIKSDRERVVVVASRSFINHETKAYIAELEQKFGDVESVSRGSSLKFCLLAEGEADYYPRIAPTMEWDTGAGHALVRNCGYKVFEYKSGKELIYNKENLLNPYFVVTK